MGNDLRKEMSDRLREIRKSRSLTQLEFAKSVGLKTQNLLSNYEGGKSDIPISVLDKLINDFSISPLWLFRGDGPMSLHKDGNTNPNGLVNLIVLNYTMMNTEIFISRKLIENYHRQNLKFLQLEDNQMLPDYHNGDLVAFQELSQDFSKLDDDYIIKKDGLLSCRSIQFIPDKKAIIQTKGSSQPYTVELDKLTIDFFYGRVIGNIHLRKNPTQLFEGRL